MRIALRPLIGLLVLATLIGTAGTALAAHRARRAATPLVREEHTKLGLVLAAADGHTLYYFTPDRPGHLACVGHCLAIWPPLLVPNGMKSPVVPKGIPGRFGVVPRGKARQLTWDGHPLYTFAGDKKVGQVNGQGLHHLWWAVVLEKAKASSGGSSGSSGSSSGGGW